MNFGDNDFKDINNPTKIKEKKLLETEELNFLLQSGIVLCKLAAIVVPGTGIETDDLQVDLSIIATMFLSICFPEWKSDDKEEEHLTFSFCRH